MTPVRIPGVFHRNFAGKKTYKKTLSTLSPKLVFDDGDLFLQLLLTKILTKMIFCYKALQNSIKKSVSRHQSEGSYSAMVKN